MAKEWLGEFELIVMLAVLRTHENAYGVTIREEILARTGRDVSIGAVYATLDRLEIKFLLRSRLGDPTPERGGRSKRLFRVTAKGMKAVQETYEATQSMASGLDWVGSLA